LSQQNIDDHKSCTFSLRDEDYLVTHEYMSCDVRCSYTSAVSPIKRIVTFGKYKIYTDSYAYYEGLYNLG